MTESEPVLQPSSSFFEDDKRGTKKSKTLKPVARKTAKPKPTVVEKKKPKAKKKVATKKKKKIGKKRKISEVTPTEKEEPPKKRRKTEPESPIVDSDETDLSDEEEEEEDEEDEVMKEPPKKKSKKKKDRKKANENNILLQQNLCSKRILQSLMDNRWQKGARTVFNEYNSDETVLIGLLSENLARKEGRKSVKGEDVEYAMAMRYYPFEKFRDFAKNGIKNKI